MNPLGFPAYVVPPIILPVDPLRAQQLAEDELILLTLALAAASGALH